MVSRGYNKRGVGLMKMNRIKNPIRMAREMLIRGNEPDGGGAAGHCELQGESVHLLAEQWGLEMVDPGYFWIKKRWDEHRKGMGKSTDRETYEKRKRQANSADADCEDSTANEVGCCEVPKDPSWNGEDYLPQGTVGCVVLDSTGTLCVATSTGGITNKLPGRIGDTPTLGAGFWAEEWEADNAFERPGDGVSMHQTTPLSPLQQMLGGDYSGIFRDCLPSLSSYLPLAHTSPGDEKIASFSHGVAMSGTGNGDSFLRLSAVRTAAAMTRFSSPSRPLQWSVTRMAGPGGMLQGSAGDRWHKTGEGEGGIIGIECVSGKGIIVADFCCGGMFRAWVDDEGKERMMVLREEY